MRNETCICLTDVVLATLSRDDFSNAIIRCQQRHIEK
jgi:hypothetical protein